jgi:hypothetical protein
MVDLNLITIYVHQVYSLESAAFLVVAESAKELKMSCNAMKKTAVDARWFRNSQNP